MPIATLPIAERAQENHQYHGACCEEGLLVSLHLSVHEQPEHHGPGRGQREHVSSQNEDRAGRWRKAFF